MAEIHLTGCAPTPLSHYLKALGILRLVGEQADSNVTGRWEAEHFVLESALDEQGLTKFLLESYRPTPILSPWNGRAGFLEGEDAEDSKRKGAVIVGRVLDSTGKRFEAYRRVISETRNNSLLTELNSLRDKVKAFEKAKKAGTAVDENNLSYLKKRGRLLKSALLTGLRGRLSDDFVGWLDACLLVGEEPIPAPLLGSGGNEGSMDFSVNHLMLLTKLFDVNDDAPTPIATEALPNSLFATNDPVLEAVNPGLLSPNSVGGPNMGSGFDGLLRDNCWNVVLMLEGALLFAASVARRLEAKSDPILSFPFVIRAVAAGHGGVSISESSRPELWIPLWNRDMQLSEVKTLLREGRATLGRRRANNALDMTRSIASLGVDRGIASFQRYGFYERRGQGYFVATPLQRVEVRRNVEASLISDLDQNGFLDRLRRKLREDNTPGRLRLLGRRLDEALLALAERAGSARVQAVIILLGAIVPHLSRLAARDKSTFPPMPRLESGWVVKADDGTPEFSIAAALAGLYAPGTKGLDQKRFPALAAGLPMACHIAPVEPHYKTWRWLEDSKLYVWAEDRLTRNLASVVERRLLETRRANIEDKPFGFRVGAPAMAVASWLEGGLNERRIADLVTGLCLARVPDHLPGEAIRERFALPAAYMVLKPFFTPDRLLRHLGFLPPDGRLPLTDDLVALLRADRVPDAIDRAWRRLRAAGVALPRFPQGAPKPPSGLSGERLLAALIVPLHFSDLARALRRLTPARIAESLTA